MIGSLDDIVDAVDAVGDRFEAARQAIADALDSDSQTDTQVQALRADLSGVAGDLRSVRRDLDAVDAVDFLHAAGGRRTIAMWRWQRRTRRALGGVVAAVVEARRIAADLRGQRQDQVVVALDGDTLQTIAARALGDWREWPRLLKSNPGLNVGPLAAGTTLALPDRR